MNVFYLAQLSCCCLARRRIALSASVCERETVVCFVSLLISKSERRSIDDLPKAFDPAVIETRREESWSLGAPWNSYETVASEMLAISGR